VDRCFAWADLGKMVSVKFPTDIDRLVDQDPLGSEPSVRMACHLR